MVIFAIKSGISKLTWRTTLIAGSATIIMSIGLRGENLIFLISQPRAGSTLSQRILGSHPEIHTIPEPWLMLHPLYALRSKGYSAEYNANWGREAVKDFLQVLPDGEEAYFSGLRRMYTYLYSCAMSGSSKRYFLDKTPRYYFIIPELYRTFPDAKFIILLRNPLAVLCSIINTWTKEEWFSLYKYKYDLTQAPLLLLEGINLLADRCLVLQYEQLLINPDREFRRICEWLGLNFSSEIINYSLNDSLKWNFGDPQGVYQNTKPDSQNLSKWALALEDPQVWRVANDYLQLLGQEIVSQMGYSYEELQQLIDEHRPHWFYRWYTFSLPWLLRQPEERKQWERYLASLVYSVKLRGFGGTMVRLVQKLRGILPSPKKVITTSQNS